MKRLIRQRVDVNVGRAICTFVELIHGIDEVAQRGDKLNIVAVHVHNFSGNIDRQAGEVLLEALLNISDERRNG